MVSVTVQRSTIVFASPISQTDWNRLAEGIDAARINDHVDLIAQVRKLATSIVADNKFRERLSSAKAWYATFAKPAVTYARQAITCAGSTLGDVVVDGNRVEGFVQGVHVGTSQHQAKPPRIATNVRIAENDLYLTKPSEAYYAPCGLFLGNMETGRIDRNLLTWSGQPKDSRFTHGIRVWGYLGRFLLITQNRISIAKLGIKVLPVNPIKPSNSDPYLWRATENLVVGVSKYYVVKAPSFMEIHPNMPMPPP
jgi:hypothetical protein